MSKRDYEDPQTAAKRTRGDPKPTVRMQLLTMASTQLERVGGDSPASLMTGDPFLFRDFSQYVIERVMVVCGTTYDRLGFFTIRQGGQFEPLPVPPGSPIPSQRGICSQMTETPSGRVVAIFDEHGGRVSNVWEYDWTMGWWKLLIEKLETSDAPEYGIALNNVLYRWHGRKNPYLEAIDTLSLQRRFIVSNPSPRSAVSLTAVGSKIWAVHGDLDYVWFLQDDEWTQTDAPALNEFGSGRTVIDNRYIWVFGERVEHYNFFIAIHVFDTASLTWLPAVHSVPYSGTTHSVVACGHDIYVFGRSVLTNQHGGIVDIVDRVDILDIDTMGWRSGPKLPDGFRVARTVAHTIRENEYVFMGHQ